MSSAVVWCVLIPVGIVLWFLAIFIVLFIVGAVINAHKDAKKESSEKSFLDAVDKIQEKKP